MKNVYKSVDMLNLAVDFHFLLESSSEKRKILEDYINNLQDSEELIHFINNLPEKSEFAKIAIQKAKEISENLSLEELEKLIFLYPYKNELTDFLKSKIDEVNNNSPQEENDSKWDELEKEFKQVNLEELDK